MKEYADKLSIPILIIVILLILSFFTILPIWDMVLLGAIFGYAIRPISRRFQTKLKYPSVSILLAIIVIVIPILLLCGYLIYEIIDLAQLFIGVNGAGSGFNLNQTVSNILVNVPAQYQSSIQYYTSYIPTIINEVYSWVLDYCIDIVKSTPVLLIQIFTVMFSTYYFARDWDNLVEYVRAFIPKKYTSFSNKMFFEIENVTKSIFYGHFVTAFIIGVVAGIGFWILGYPFVILLAIVTCICQIIPVIGPWPVYWALVIIDLINGNFPRAIVTLFFGFGLSICDVYIRPALAGKYADIPAMILLLGFMAGPLVFGLMGFVVGPLILGITYAVIKAYKEEIIENKDENSAFYPDIVEEDKKEDVLSRESEKVEDNN